MSRIRSIEDVVAYQLCTGCGVCVFMAPEGLVMTDVIDVGRRPISRTGAGMTRPEVLDACPGIRLEHDESSFPDGVIESLRESWGPVLAVWEGYAADPEVRFRGSSGGAATALSLFALEKEGVDGVLHTVASQELPYLTTPRLSRTRVELIEGSGSRYAPASPGSALDAIEAVSTRAVFVGKPCDVAGLRRAAAYRPGLRDKLDLVIGFFCAGTPSTRGTLELMRLARVAADDVVQVRYRGNGWPGRWATTMNTGNGPIETTLSYEESWGFLQQYRQWRCHICPDHTGEFADVAVGDPWYRTPVEGEPGRSLIVARTERGLEAVLAAARAGYLELEKSQPELLPASQPNLLRSRGRLFGQMLTLRALGVPTPTYVGMPTYRTWLRHLGWRDKARSVLGTLRRIRRRDLRKRLDVERMERIDGA